MAGKPLVSTHLAAVHGQECVAVEVINTAHAIGLDRWTSGHLERNGTSSQGRCNEQGQREQCERANCRDAPSDSAGYWCAIRTGGN